MDVFMMNRKREAMRDKPASTGFTLIELLVVISIIGLLVAIMLPALNTARMTARTIVCASKMKQIGLAFVMYGHDYDDWINPAYARGPNFWNGDFSGRPWIERIARITQHSPNDYGLIYRWNGNYPNDDHRVWDSKESFLCPEQPRELLTSGFTETLHYGINRHIAGDFTTLALRPFHRFSQLNAPPAAAVLLTDIQNTSHYLSFVENYSQVSFRHNNVTNQLYADGHVQSLNGDTPGGEIDAMYLVGK